MAPKARKRPAAGALKSETGASYSMMARAGGENSNHSIEREFQELADHETPYGRIVKRVDLQRDDNSYFRLAYACPFALFWYLCQETPYFFPFLVTWLGLLTAASLVFYMDETRPGNILRPDMARAMHGLFWGIADLPDWYRAKRVFWIPFAHVPSREMKRIRGGPSAVYLKVCEVFWPIPIGLHHFERTGVEARGRTIKFAYGFMIVDEKCEKEVSGVKGAAGVKCCLSCLNCVRTQKEITPGSGLVKFSEPDMSKFEKNTPEILSAALDHLAEQKGVLSKTKFAELEVQLGINYEDCVLLYSPYRDMINLPTSRCTDWFHDLLASGGVYQLLVNEVVLDVLEGTGLSLGDIDGFQADVSLPEGSRMSKTFFADRVVELRGAHFKGFAADTISAVFVLCFMFECVFEDPAAFAQQRRLCTLARESLEILLAGDKAVRLADRLDDVLEQLQVLLLTLYPWCDIPKIHLMRHIKDGLIHFRKNLSCCSGERLHRRSKELGRFAYNKAQDTILIRTVKALVDDANKEDTFSHTVFEGKARTLVVLGVRRESWASVRVGRNRTRAGDVVHWVLGGRCLGRVRGIVRCEGKAIASVAVLSPLADGTLSCAVLREVLVECAVLEGSLPYMEVGENTFKVLTPA